MTVSSEALRAESEIIDRLTARAEKYVAAIGVILAFPLVEQKKLAAAVSTTHNIPTLLVSTGAVVLLLGLFPALYGMRLRNFASYPSTDALWALDSKTVSPDDAKRSVVKMYLEIRDRNRLVNKKRARVLASSGVLILVGVFFIISAQVWMKIW
jgi:hypothetical protein